MTPTSPARRASLASRLSLTALLCGGLLAGCGFSGCERAAPVQADCPHPSLVVFERAAMA